MLRRCKLKSDKVQKRSHGRSQNGKKQSDSADINHGKRKHAIGIRVVGQTRNQPTGEQRNKHPKSTKEVRKFLKIARIFSK